MSSRQTLDLGLVAADLADTSDDWYTPGWLFEAAGVTFDLDVAAPVDPTRRTCPALKYLTPLEDGLAQPWHGLVWMNPPYSRCGPWVDRWSKHPEGLALLPAARSAWLGVLVGSTDALTFVECDFLRNGGPATPGKLALILAARGERSIEALARIAVVDRIAQGGYLVGH